MHMPHLRQSKKAKRLIHAGHACAYFVYLVAVTIEGHGIYPIAAGCVAIIMVVGHALGEDAH